MAEGMDVVALTKRYICDDRYRMRLFEAVGQEVRSVSGVLREERFAVTSGWSDEEFRKRVPAFEEVVAGLPRRSADCPLGRRQRHGNADAAASPGVRRHEQ